MARDDDFGGRPTRDDLDAIATHDEQQANIGAWDAMMAKVAGMPEIEQLRAEVDRLRAREQAPADENAAAIDELEWQREINQQLGAENEQKQAMIDVMRPLIEMLANGGVAYEADGTVCQCAFCLDYTTGSDDELMQHLPDCPVIRARAFVAAHPTATAAGEAESEGE